MSEASQFPWQALRVLCGAHSILDIDKLELKSEAEAYQFVLSYGYDLYESSHIDQLERIRERAIEFMERYLCEPGSYPDVLRNVKLADDLKTLLLIASGQNISKGALSSDLRLWICATLRVMHVVSHLQSDLRLKYLPKIKRQTVDRIEAHIQKTPSGEIFLGYETDKVPLVGFYKKESKVRDSIMMKLLHKPSATAQEVYDHIGVRFVTKNRIDAFKIIKYLVGHHLIAYPNVMASRVRNSLMTLEDFQKLLEGPPDEWSESEKAVVYPSTRESQNPFSSPEFHSLQFTARQLIRIPVIRKGGQRREMIFFFPIEFQILDEKSFRETESGEAGHLIYKQKQLEAVRQRVLRGLAPGA